MTQNEHRGGSVIKFDISFLRRLAFAVGCSVALVLVAPALLYGTVPNTFVTGEIADAGHTLPLNCS